MRVIEQAIRGRRRDASPEDLVVVTDDFAAVIDGATDKSGRSWLLEGVEVSSGRFAATVVAAAVAALPATVDARTAVDIFTAMLAGELARQAPGLGTEDRPAAGVALYSRAARQVWRVGDVQVAVDGEVVFRRGVAVERVAADFRAAYVAALRAGGVPVADLLASALPRQAALPLLRLVGLLANTAGEFGFGTINGAPVPDTHVEVLEAAGAGEIVIASDGYPRVLASLDDSERYLAEALERDPLCVEELRGVKGVEPGAESFDDRAWLRLGL